MARFDYTCLHLPLLLILLYCRELPLQQGAEESTLHGFTHFACFVSPSFVMEEILRAVCPTTASAILGQNAVSTNNICGSQDQGGKRDLAEGNVECLKAIKNALVGNNGAKQVALRLGIVEKILSSFDAINTDHGDSTFLLESTTTHAMGLFAILTSTPSSRDYFTPVAVDSVAGHIARALASPNERLLTTTLRALTELCINGVITRPAELAHGGVAATNIIIVAITPVAKLVLEKVAGGHRSMAWMANVKRLGFEALAALTRDCELAKVLEPSVVSTGTLLIRPLFPASDR